MKDLSKFYDGHDDNARLLDQLIDCGSIDKNGYFTKNKELIICDYNNQLAGMVCINNKRGGASKLGPIIVNPDLRSIGIGKLLHEASVDSAQLNNARKIYMTTSSLNEIVTGLLKKYKFIIEAQFPDQYKKGSNENIWGLPLVPYLIDSNQNIRSVLTDSKEEENNADYNISLYTEADKQYLKSISGIYQQWHDDLGDDFLEMMISGQKRVRLDGLSFQNKSKLILMAKNKKQENVGALTFTPKRGGPVKLYPIAGTIHAQEQLLNESEKIAKENKYHKLYTFVQKNDKKELDFLGSYGFQIRGELLSPYKNGYNLIPLDKFVD
jgi:ribosomal protein S18 acetylase RimI-like enzyme